VRENRRSQLELPRRTCKLRSITCWRKKVVLYVGSGPNVCAFFETAIDTVGNKPSLSGTYYSSYKDSI
jgi:hypothetical protein